MEQGQKERVQKLEEDKVLVEVELLNVTEVVQV
jgi:hypothetical protein